MEILYLQLIDCIAYHIGELPDIIMRKINNRQYTDLYTDFIESTEKHKYDCKINKLLECELSVLIYLLRQVTIKNLHGNEITCDVVTLMTPLSGIALYYWKPPHYESKKFDTAATEVLFHFITILIKSKHGIKIYLARKIGETLSLPSYRFKFEQIWKCLLQSLELIYKEMDVQHKDLKKILHNDSVLTLEYLCKQKLINEYGTNFLNYFFSSIANESKLINNLFISIDGIINKHTITINLERAHKDFFHNCYSAYNTHM